MYACLHRSHRIILLFAVTVAIHAPATRPLLGQENSSNDSTIALTPIIRCLTEEQFVEGARLAGDEITRFPRSGILHYYRGACLTSLGRYSEAFDECTMAAQDDSVRPRALHLKGRIFEAQGSHFGAARYFHDAFILDSTLRAARSGMIRELCLCGRTAMAAQALPEPPSADDEMQVSRAFLAAGLFDEAWLHAGRAFEADSNRWTVQLLRADILFAKGEYTGALAGYVRLDRQVPGVYAVLRKLALCYEKPPVKNLPTAVLCMERALALAGDTSLADADKLGGWLFAMGMFDSAAVFFQKEVRIDSTISESHFNLGLALLQGGDVAGGIKELEQAVAMAAGRVEYASTVYRNLGIAYGRQKRLGKTLAAYRRAYALTPRQILAVQGLAATYDELGRKAEAMSWYGKVLVMAKGRDDGPGFTAGVRRRMAYLKGKK